MIHAWYIPLIKKYSFKAFLVSITFKIKTLRNLLPNSQIVGLRTTYLINECKNLISLCTLKII